MEVTYHLTKNDYADFYVYHFTKMPAAFRRQQVLIRVLMTVGPLIFIVLACGLLGIQSGSVPTEAYYAAGIVGLICCGVAFFLYPVFMKQDYQEYAAKTYSELIDKGYSGTSTLTLSEKGVAAKSNLGEGTMAWSAVEAIYETDQHIFIYLSRSAGNAMIIPKNAFTSKIEEKAFIEYAASQIKTA